MNDVNMEVLKHLIPHELIGLIKNRADTISDINNVKDIDVLIFRSAINSYMNEHENLYSLIFDLLNS